MPLKRLAVLATAGVLAACALRPSATPPSPSPSSVPAPPTPEPGGPVVRFAAVGDVGAGNDAQRRLAERIAALHAERRLDVLLILGDVIYPDGEGDRYQANFARPFEPVLRAGIPIAAVLGNHDHQTAAGAEVRRLLHIPGRTYSLRIGPVSFFALDSTVLDAAQVSWLASELGRTTATWRVVLLHHPPYSSGRHGSSLGVRRLLEPVVRNGRAQLVLAGHDHDYERTRPIGGVTYIVAGTGCCPRPVGRSPFTAAAASTVGVLVAEAGAERLSLRFVDAAGRELDRSELAAHRPAGDV